MTFEIEYYFSDSERSEAASATDIDESSLRYYLFPGSVYLDCSVARLEFDWGWIPLLDFAICLSGVVENLNKAAKGIEEFDFTESENTITCTRDGNLVKVDASSTEESLVVSWTEFREGFKRFHKNVFADALVLMPDLENNVTFLEYARKGRG